MDRLDSNDGRVVQFLAKLAAQLVEHLNYPSEHYPLITFAWQVTE